MEYIWAWYSSTGDITTNYQTNNIPAYGRKAYACDNLHFLHLVGRIIISRVNCWKKTRFYFFSDTKFGENYRCGRKELAKIYRLVQRMSAKNAGRSNWFVFTNKVHAPSKVQNLLMGGLKNGDRSNIGRWSPLQEWYIVIYSLCTYFNLA